MALRLGRLVGLACIGLVLARLGRVLTTGTETTDWRVIALAAGSVGALITWTGLTYRLRAPVTILLHLLGMTLLALRVTAAPTLRFGVLPGPDTAEALSTTLGYALEILQFGAPPVLAVPGLVALVGIAVWLLAATWAWGAISGRVWLGIVPPLGFYLYLSVMDRLAGGPRWNLALALLVTLGLLATSQVSRAGSGRVRDSSNRPIPRRRFGASATVVAVVVVAGLAATAALGGTAPGTGTLNWRNPGSGAGGDGLSLNRFAGLRQNILSQSDTPAFFARVEGAGGPVTRQMYWKLLTLDVFDGQFWRPRERDFTPVGEATAWESPALAYRGPTTRVVQTIAIESLRDDLLPALYSPVGITSDHDVVTSGASVADDASLRINAITYQGLTYTVESDVPTLDLAALASDRGELSPLFESAAAEGLIDILPSQDVPTTRPAAIESYLRLPAGISPAVAELTAEVTADAATPFEQALLIEDFLRGFRYSTQVDTGHSSLDLAEWLTVEDSRNYRTGYCEQFATAMAVMGRLSGLPTRIVLGFTHGQLDAETGTTVVRQRNAHAWVEVWFDEAGWVQFDPTPRGDGTTTPTAAAIGFDPGAVTLPNTSPAGVTATDQPGFLDDVPILPVDTNPDGTGFTAETWRWVVLATAAVLGLTVLPVMKRIRRNRRRRRAHRDDITAVWEEIVDRLSDLGQAPAPSATPLEFAAGTDPSLVPLAHAYSAAVYGDEEVGGAVAHLERAERWLDSRYDGLTQARAAYSLRSVKRRKPG